MPALETRLIHVIHALLLCVPILDLTVGHGGSVPIGVLAALGVMVGIGRRASLSFKPEELTLFGALIAYCLVSVLSVTAWDFPEEGIDKLELHLRLLAIIPIYLLLRHVKPLESVLWYGLIAGAILTGIVALYEVVVLGQQRATGDNNSIHFGNISLLMGFMSAAALPRMRATYGLRVLPLLAFIMGLAASVLSGTRGAWIALPALIILLGWTYRRYLSRAIIATGIALVVAMPVVFYVVPETEMITEDVAGYIIQDERDVASTSVNIRRDMWRVALDLSMQHPLFGVGLGNYQLAVRPYVASGFAHRSILPFDHPHNEYLAALMSCGLVGLLALLGVLVAPAMIFYRAYRADDPQCAALGLAGLLLMIGYAHHGATNNIFERGVSLSFFVYAVAFIAALIHNREAMPARDGRA